MKKTTPFLIGSAVVVAAGIALAQTGKRVFYQGAVVSSDVRVINGHRYVPLDDMARALGGKVTLRGDGFEIAKTTDAGSAGSGRTAPGGANEVRGQNGGVGDWFFNGFWRFQVKSVERADEYACHFSADSRVDKPEGNNDELVVLTCVIKNGHKEAEQPILAVHGTSAQKTALGDDQGQSYAPTDFDVRGGDLLPGAARSFAVVFSVPKGTNIRTLIFTCYGYGASSTKATNMRVTLTP